VNSDFVHTVLLGGLIAALVAWRPLRRHSAKA